MSAAQTLRPGRYRHFKGKEYELLFVATHSETLEPMVVYRALYGERGVWVRPFNRNVYLMPPYCIEPEDLRRLG